MTSRAIAQGRLETANRVRLAGAKLRRELKALGTEESRLRAAEILTDPPPAAQRMRLDRFLTAIHRIGPRQAVAIMNEASVPHERRIGPEARIGDATLTARQRLAVAQALRRRVKERR